ncbi:hypothetical protein [Natrinema halophilum]|uniref:hypothetical protein n=1 Tax=Natrinema halophilum TaxID=1699371 RepID=UPI0031BA17C8
MRFRTRRRSSGDSARRIDRKRGESPDDRSSEEVLVAILEELRAIWAAVEDGTGHLRETGADDCRSI